VLQEYYILAKKK